MRFIGVRECVDFGDVYERRTLRFRLLILTSFSVSFLCTYLQFVHFQFEEVIQKPLSIKRRHIWIFRCNYQVTVLLHRRLLQRRHFLRLTKVIITDLMIPRGESPIQFFALYQTQRNILQLLKFFLGKKLGICTRFKWNSFVYPWNTLGTRRRYLRILSLECFLRRRGVPAMRLAIESFVNSVPFQILRLRGNDYIWNWELLRQR
jgi:hypothetical protein